MKELRNESLNLKEENIPGVLRRIITLKGKDGFPEPIDEIELHTLKGVVIPTLTSIQQEVWRMLHLVELKNPERATPLNTPLKFLPRDKVEILFFKMVLDKRVPWGQLSVPIKNNFCADYLRREFTRFFERNLKK